MKNKIILGIEILLLILFDIFLVSYLVTTSYDAKKESCEAAINELDYTLSREWYVNCYLHIGNPIMQIPVIVIGTFLLFLLEVLIFMGLTAKKQKKVK